MLAPRLRAPARPPLRHCTGALAPRAMHRMRVTPRDGGLRGGHRLVETAYRRAPPLRRMTRLPEPRHTLCAAL